MRLSNIFEQDPATATGAASVSRAMGSAASGASVARALGKAAHGDALNPTLVKSIAPYADALDKILSTPAFRNKFTQLVKQVQSLDKKNQEIAAQQGAVTEDQDSVDAVASSITRRIMMQHTELLSKYGPVKVMAAIDDVAEFAGGDGLDEIGSSDVSIWTKQVIQDLEAGHYDRVEEEQIDELSKGTLGSYVKKAADSTRINTRWAARTGDRDAEDIVDKRRKGINKAVDKMTKEEAEGDKPYICLYVKKNKVLRHECYAPTSYEAAKKAAGHWGLKSTAGVSAHLADDSDDVKEAEGDTVDTVSLDVPLLLRVLEFARESVQDDMGLHDVAERMIAMSKEGPLTMDDYDNIVGDVEALPAPVDEVSNKTLSSYTDKAAKERDAYHPDRNKDAESARKYYNRKAGVRKALSITQEDSGKSKQYIEIVSVLGHTKRVPVHPLNAYKALNHYRDQPSTKSARIVSEDNDTTVIPENYYTPGPETMPGAVGPAETTNVSYNQTKRMGDATVTVSANAKDMEELHRVLKLAGIEVKGVADAEPSVADAAVALAPNMPAEPAEEPCGYSSEPESSVKPLDFKYSTDKTALVNVLRDRLKRL